jgi:hypothetical protein
MKKIYLLLVLLVQLFMVEMSNAQCYTATYGLWPTGTFTPACSGTFQNITTGGYAGEYSNVNLVAGTNYTFRSSITTDYITVDDNGAAPLVGVVGISGAAGITWTCTATGTYRFYTHTSSACGSNTTSRTRMITCTAAAPTAPANNLVCSATAITCGATLSGTTVNATNSGTGENGFCGISQTMPGVWYVVAGNGQTMTASLCATAWDSKMSIFSGTNCSTLTCIGGNDDWGPACSSSSASYSWPSVVGQNYYILVHGYSANSAFSINLSCVTPPPAAYNPCTTIPTLTCGAAATSYSMAGSAGSWSSFGGVYTTPGQEKLFAFTPTVSGVHNVTVSTSSGYVDLFWKAQSSGCNSTGWTYVNDIFGTETWGINLTAGVVYYIMLDDEDTFSNTGTISITCPASPPPNPCAAAISIPSLPVNNQSLVCSASNNLNSSNVPACGAASTSYMGGNEALYTVTPSTSGPYTISYNGVTWSSVWVWANACPASGGTCVGSTASSASTQTLNVNLTAGITYYVMFDTWPSPNSPCPGTFSITAPPPPPANDNCANAQSVTIQCPVGATAISGTTANATEEAMADPSCDPGTIRDVWYTFNSGNNTSVNLSVTLGTANWLGGEIHTTCGNPAPGLTIGGNAGNCDFYLLNPSPTIISGLVPNTTYRLRLFTNVDFDIAGTFSFTLTNSTNNPGAISVPPSICVGTPTSISNVTAATGGPNNVNYYFYYRGGPSNIGWQMYDGPTTNTSSSLPAAVINTPGTWFIARNSDFGCGQLNNATTLDLQIIVNQASTAPALSGTSPVCPAASVTINATGGTASPGSTINWYTGPNGTGSFLGTGSSYTVTPSATTTYYARREGGCNTTSDGTYTITVNALPTWGNLQWPPSGAICAGGTYDIYGQVYENGVTNANFHAPGAGIVAQFGYSTSNSNPNTWSTWSTATYNVGVGNNDEFKGTFSGLSAGTYYYAFRYALNNGTCYVYGGYNVSGGGFWNGTTNVSGVLTVNAIPSISGTANVCMGSSTALTGSGTAASSNAWSSTNTGVGTINTTTTTGTLSPVAVGTTNVTYTDNNGCVSAATTVTVNALPTVTATASAASLCSGSNLTLTGGGASTYAWNNGVTNGVAFTPNATQTYTVTGTNANGCVNTASTSVTVNALPTANAGLDIIDPSTCGKNTVNVGGNALAAGQSGQWSVLSATNNGGNQGLFSLAGTAANDQFTGAYGGTYVLQWALTSGGCTGTDQMTVTFNQPSDATISAMVGSGDLLWCGLTNTDWSTSTNWYQKQVAGHYIRMSGAVQPGIGNEVFTVSTANGGMCVGNSTPSLSVNSNAEDVYVGAGVVLNLSNDSINIAQNLINQGTIAASTGTVNFTGNNNSTVSGSGTTQLFNMRVNKSAGATLTLQQPVLVTNVLTMNQGNVFTTSANLLTLGSSSAAPGSLSYNSGTIVGPFKRYFANAASAGTAGLFPVGTAVYNRYADFNFGSGPGVDQFLTVEYMTGAPLQGGVPLYNGLPLTASGSLIQNYSADGYWSVIPTNNNYTAPITSVNYGVTLFANNLTGMQSPQVCRIIKSAGSNTVAQHHVAWQACGTHTAINGAANPQAFLITSTATQGFSWFNIGTPNSQALPVELLSFNGDCNEGQVNISWQTATEHNSDYFEVEKSRDGMNWQVLTTVNAAGNSTQLLNYEATDAHAMEGNNYYRLTQVDIDGTTKTYDVINVSCSGAAKGYFSAYPNPSTGSFQVILNDKNLVGSGNLSVKDTKGAELLNRTIEVKPGINMFSVTDLNLAPGVYYIQIVNGERATEVLKEVIR